MGWVVLVLIFACTPPVLAHPGRTDNCGGHTVTSRVEYPPNPDGQLSYPSEKGEYHFHLSLSQLGEAKLTLAEYRAAHLGSSAHGPDYGSFTVEGRSYDILEKTRQDEAIVRCGDDVTKVGIMRAE